MVVLHAELASLGPGAAALVLQIHDEVLLEVDRDQVDQVRAAATCCFSELAFNVLCCTYFGGPRAPVHVRP